MTHDTGIQYLSCRKGRYTVRVQVPRELQKQLNQTEFKRSLGGDWLVAKRECHGVIAEFLGKINEARRADDVAALPVERGVISKLEIESAARSHYKRMVKTISMQGSLNRTEKIHGLQEVIDAHLSINSHGQWSAVAIDAQWLSDEHGWRLDESGEDFEYLCEAMLRARLQAYRDEVRRLEGIRAADPNVDPLFDPKLIVSAAKTTLGSLIDEFNAERGPKWSLSTKVNYRIITRVLEEICGRDTPVSEIDRAFCRKVRDVLIQMPSNYQKKPETKGKAIAEVIEIGERLGLPRMKPATINSHLSKLGAIIALGRDAGLIIGNPMANIEVLDHVRPQEKRDPFSPTQLNQLFSSAPWSDGPEGALKNASKYWGPLVALFSGARLSEIFGQLVDEVIEREGRLLFDFRHRPGEREMKHDKSRIVPVHPVLLELGFGKFVADARKSGRTLLFPEAKRDARGKWGDAISDWFSRRIKQLNLTGTNLSFHSFRHSFEDALREADLHNSPIANQITGRWTPGVSTDYGGKDGYSTARLHEAMAKVRYPELEIAHLIRG